MRDESISRSSDSVASALPQAFGWLSLPGVIALTLRLGYEQTFLTWRDGVQMVGFALAHSSTILFGWMLLSAVIAIGYLLSVAVILVVRWFRGERTQLNAMPGTVLILLFAVLFIPYERWMALGLRLGVAKAHQPEYLVQGAALGHKYLVDAALKSGVAIDETESSGTALNAACINKQIEMARYLISKGADLSRAPECKWIPAVGGKVLPRVPGTTIRVTQ